MDTPKAILSRQIKATSLRKTAVNIGISAAHLSDIMRGKRNAGNKVLRALGMTRKVTRRITYAPAAK